MIGSAKDYAQKQNDQAGGQLVQSGQDLLDAVGLVRKGKDNLIIKISHQKRLWKKGHIIGVYQASIFSH